MTLPFRTAFNTITGHARTEPSAHILLAAGTPLSFSNMHMACEYHLPQAGAVRRAGIWRFPAGGLLRVARILDENDAEKFSNLTFSLISVHGGSDVVALLQTMLTPQGRIIPFLGYY